MRMLAIDSIVFRPAHRPALAVLLAATLLLGRQSAWASPGIQGPTRIGIASKASDCTLGNNGSQGGGISASGRIVILRSLASNLAAGDTNATWDVFVHDRDPDEDGILDEDCGVTRRVSVTTDGTQGPMGGGDPYFSPVISADGRHAFFHSYSANLTPGLSGAGDAFAHDLRTGITTCVSVGSSGEPGNGFSGGPSVSADGRHVAFTSYSTTFFAGDVNSQPDLFVHDRDADGNGAYDEAGGMRTTLMSRGFAGDLPDGVSHLASMSDDGRIIAFRSLATNLVPNDTNGVADVFVHDRDADGDGVEEDRRDQRQREEPASDQSPTRREWRARTVRHLADSSS